MPSCWFIQGKTWCNHNIYILIVARLFKIVWEKSQWVWLYAHCFIAHLQVLKIAWNLVYLICHNANKDIIIDTSQPSTSIGIWKSESTGCKQPSSVSETLLKFFILILDTNFWEEAFLITFIALNIETLLMVNIFVFHCVSSN